MNFTLTQQEYESLIALARRGATTSSEQGKLEEFLKLIEVTNGVTRSIVVVLWQEIDEPQPSDLNFPDNWPPTKKYTIELTSRPVARTDVDAVIKAQAKNATNILCTRDPAGVFGLTPVADFFLT